MPLTQGLYLEGSTDLREGEIAYAGVTTDILTGYNADTVILPFGRAVIFAGAATGMNERTGLVLPSADAQIVRGILVATDTIERMPGVTIDTNGNPGYPLTTAVNAVLPSYATKGIVAVRTAEAVTKGGAVTAFIAAGATRGLFGTGAAAAGTEILCPSTWEWASSAASGAIGLIYMK